MRPTVFLATLFFHISNSQTAYYYLGTAFKESFISTQSLTIPEERLKVKSWNVETAFENELKIVCKSIIFVAFR